MLYITPPELIYFIIRRTRGMETWNGPTADRGQGEGDNGGRKGKELVKEHV